MLLQCFVRRQLMCHLVSMAMRVSFQSYICANCPCKQSFVCVRVFKQDWQMFGIADSMSLMFEKIVDQIFFCSKLVLVSSTLKHFQSTQSDINCITLSWLFCSYTLDSKYIYIFNSLLIFNRKSTFENKSV